jgi:hypothetical protein
MFIHLQGDEADLKFRLYWVWEPHSAPGVSHLGFWGSRTIILSTLSTSNQQPLLTNSEQKKLIVPVRGGTRYLR